jgi:hypothetical protein
MLVSQVPKRQDNGIIQIFIFRIQGPLIGHRF